MTDPRPLRFSSLKRMGESPAHYRAALERPFKPTAAQKLGTAVHRLVFENRDVLVCDGDRRSKAFKELQAAHPDDDSIITASEYETAKAMRDALWNHVDARQLLWNDRLVSERALTWRIGSRECQGTPDGFVPGEYLLDLKTSQCGAPRKWTGRYGEIRKYAYHAQLPWYENGLEQNGFGPVPEQYIPVVESKWPHVVQVYRLDASELEAGRMLWRSWFETLRVCEQSDFWPGYSQQIVTVCAPEDDGDMPDLVFGETEEAAE